jgi:RimJ/RimL family protein N-acetyltransferase
LLAAAFHGVLERGLSEATAEADETNHASITLLERIAARRTGTTLELIRRHRMLSNPTPLTPGLRRHGSR